MLVSFPILTRAYRTQWRKPQFSLWIFALSAACALVFGLAYADGAATDGAAEARLNDVGSNLWLVLAWLQIALALLVAPALSAGSIARERERGLLEGLMLAPLPPGRIVLEKWLTALVPLLLLFVVLMPFSVFATAMQRQGTAPLMGVWVFQFLLASACTAIGIACSAWARRAHLALRSAYGMVLLWVLASGGASVLSGTNPIGVPLMPGYKAPFYVKWLALSNPLLGAYDLIMEQASGAYWPSACASLLLITALCFWSATRALRRPLAPVPFIGDSQKAAAARKSRTKNVDASGHFEVPIFGSVRFTNPVLGREVRSKFRLRQPPRGVIIAEGLLAILVAYFYARTLWTAFTDPAVRGIIFWGVVITGYIVTLMACLIMGANGFSREHEGGTWESLRLSLLRPREIIWGKVAGIALTCLLFSLPFWPLLLPCLNWSAFWDSAGSAYDITISQLVAVILVWFGSIATATLLGLWWGRRTRKTSAASGAALGMGTLWFACAPLIGTFSGGANSVNFALMWLNPFVALTQTAFDASFYNEATALGLPFLAFSLAFAFAVAASLEHTLKREFG